MIKETITYNILCDNCDEDLNEYLTEDWETKEEAEEYAKACEWVKENDRHLCPDCKQCK